MRSVRRPVCLLWRRPVKIGLVLILLGGLAGTGHAQGITPETVKQVQEEPLSYEPDYEEWRDCGLRKEDIDVFVSHRSPRGKTEKNQATLNVTYSSDFPDAAIEAYERAVSIWEAHIESSVEIRIDAGRIANPDPNVLGGTIPNEFWVVETDGGDRFIAGDALADALVGSDIGEEELDESNPPDMLTDFNFDRSDWHFGEGDASAGELDFTTVALHEIAHGLHYLSLCRYDQGTGQCTFELSDGSREAGIYTDFLFEQSDGDLTVLSNEEEFPPNSQVLGDALTSNQLVFSGGRADAAARNESSGPVPPEIYAPASYQPGSSISHVDETTYPRGSRNALMTPRVNAAETNRNPGSLVCGQLADMGWPLGDQCNRFFSNFVNFRFDDPAGSSSSSVTLNWDGPDDTNVREYRIELKTFDGLFKTVRTGITAPPVTIDNLGIGRFAFRVRWIGDDGSENVSLNTPTRTVNVEGVTGDVASRDEQGRATVALDWNVPAGTPESFTYRIERAPGGGKNFRGIGTTSQQQFAAEGQTPGDYRYRIVSRDGKGNTLASDARSVEIEFDGSVFVTGPFPNPVRDRTTVEFTAREGQDVSIEVFNTLGKRIFFEERRVFAKRPTRLTFDSFDQRQWGSGMYILRVSGSAFTKTRQMMVVR